AYAGKGGVLPEITWVEPIYHVLPGLLLGPARRDQRAGLGDGVLIQRRGAAGHHDHRGRAAPPERGTLPAGRPRPRPLGLARPVMRAQREVGWHRQAALPMRNFSDLVAAGTLQLAPCGSTRTGDYMEIRATP